MTHSKQVAGALGLTLAAWCTGQAQQATIDKAGWLAGCWELRTPTRLVLEMWTAPAGGAMVETGRTIVRGRFAEAELVILRVEGEQLVYFASPLSQATTKFPATTVSDTLLIFENPSHDFPKKVGYRRVGADSLQAWIEGDGRKVPFPYARVRCDTVLR